MLQNGKVWLKTFLSTLIPVGWERQVFSYEKHFLSHFSASSVSKVIWDYFHCV